MLLMKDTIPYPSAEICVEIVRSDVEQASVTFLEC